MALPGGQVPLTMQYQALYESSGPAKCRARVTCVVNLDRWRVLLGYSASFDPPDSLQLLMKRAEQAQERSALFVTLIWRSLRLSRRSNFLAPSPL